MDTGTSRVIGTCALLTVGVGTANTLIKKKELPAIRFFVGCGAAFIILSALAEGEPEVAKALSLAVTATVVIGEGGGVLSYINEKGEIDTQKRPKGNGDTIESFTPDVSGESVTSLNSIGFPGETVKYAPESLAPIVGLRPSA